MWFDQSHNANASTACIAQQLASLICVDIYAGLLVYMLIAQTLDHEDSKVAIINIEEHPAVYKVYKIWPLIR